MSFLQLRNNLLKIYFDSSALSLPSLQLSLLVNEKIKIQTRISSSSDSWHIFYGNLRWLTYYEYWLAGGSEHWLGLHRAFLGSFLECSGTEWFTQTSKFSFDAWKLLLCHRKSLWHKTAGVSIIMNLSTTSNRWNELVWIGDRITCQPGSPWLHHNESRDWGRGGWWGGNLSC